jgi:hypothetical protein
MGVSGAFLSFRAADFVLNGRNHARAKLVFSAR